MREMIGHSGPRWCRLSFSSPPAKKVRNDRHSGILVSSKLWKATERIAVFKSIKL